MDSRAITVFIKGVRWYNVCLRKCNNGAFCKDCCFSGSGLISATCAYFCSSTWLAHVIIGLIFPSGSRLQVSFWVWVPMSQTPVHIQCIEQDTSMSWRSTLRKSVWSSTTESCSSMWPYGGNQNPALRCTRSAGRVQQIAFSVSLFLCSSYLRVCLFPISSCISRKHYNTGLRISFTTRASWPMTKLPHQSTEGSRSSGSRFWGRRTAYSVLCQSYACSPVQSTSFDPHVTLTHLLLYSVALREHQRRFDHLAAAYCAHIQVP